jgi:hypothetical protein
VRKTLFTLALLASALSLPLAAHADTIDDFVLTGDGHIITYSLPATASFPDHPNFDFFAETAPTTIDGVTTVDGGNYYSPFFPWVNLILGVPYSTSGTPGLTNLPPEHPLHLSREDTVRPRSPNLTPFFRRLCALFDGVGGVASPPPTTSVSLAKEIPAPTLNTSVGEASR